MAKIYKTEREILTIDIPIEINPDQLPQGVVPEKVQTIKVSAYPAAWKWLAGDLLVGKKELRKIIVNAIERADEMMPEKKVAVSRDYKEFLTDADAEIVYRMSREEKGVYHRGKKAKIPDTYYNLEVVSRWLLALFRYYRKRKKDRPAIISQIYEACKKHYGSAISDPTKLTYYCCKILYKDCFEAKNLPFPAEESFRTRYLPNPGKYRPLNSATPEIVSQHIDNPEHQLYIVHSICRKLQK